MYIETERLYIKELEETMAESLFFNSLDEDTKRFLPDEVFDNVEQAKEKIIFLRSCYEKKDKPLVYAVTLKNNQWIGYVQLVPYQDTWEIGYHIGKKYTGHGYATEAVKNFLSVIMPILKINKVYGICLKENIASCRVLENCTFVQIFDGIDNYQGKQQEICKYIFYK